MAEHMVALCDQCSKPYHLNQRTDLPGDDCGQVWISEEHLALEFACNSCLNPPVEEPPSSLDDILDVSEAAEVAGVSDAQLTLAAEGGELRHRKTSSGTYLFERRDVVSFARGRNG